MTSHLQMVGPTDPPGILEDVADIIQGLRGLDAYNQSPARQHEIITDIEARAMKLYNRLAPKPIQGVPFFTGRDGAA